jgi:hypothetical protein
VSEANRPSTWKIAALAGAPPLLAGEDGVAYDELLARILGHINPRDILEEIWVRDVVDLTWDVLRLRRLKAILITSHALRAVRDLLELRSGLLVALSVIENWQRCHEDPMSELESIGLTKDAVMARALANRIDDVERIDRMIMLAETRRNASLREVERHRASLAQSLRRTIENVEEAEIQVVEADPAASVP